MSRFPGRVIAAAFAALTLASVARAQDSIALSLRFNTNMQPRIAVLPVDGQYGDSIRAIIQRDLDNSDAFQVQRLDNANPAALRAANRMLDYQLLATRGIQVVVEATTTTSGLHVVIHSVDDSRVATVKDHYFSEPPPGRAWRMHIHMVSDWVQEYVTGARGMAATRVSYMRDQRVWQIDSDGAGGTDVVIPTENDATVSAWHPNGEILAYNTIGDASRIMTVDLRTGESFTMVGPAPSVSFASPAFGPDGTLYYSRATGKTTEIWSIPRNGKPAQITNTPPFLNVTPTASPDGRRVAFMSDRAGDRDVYIANTDGTNVDLMVPSVGGAKDPDRGDPDWSPDGRKLALISAENGTGRFQVVVMNVSDKSARILTSEGINQQPSWAPDSRHIVFTSDRLGGRLAALFIVDIETGKTRQLTHNPGAKYPAWSPRLTPR